MSTEHNKAMLRRIFDEVVNEGNTSITDELLASDYVNYSFPAPAPGAEGFKQVIGMFRAGFPDLHVTVEEMIAEGDRIVSRGYFTGTHRGEFMGMPATGRQVRVPYLDIWVVKNGKLAENWVQMDLLGLMQQLGVIPPAMEAAA